MYWYSEMEEQLHSTSPFPCPQRREQASRPVGGDRVIREKGVQGKWRGEKRGGCALSSIFAAASLSRRLVPPLASCRCPAAPAAQSLLLHSWTATAGHLGSGGRCGSRAASLAAVVSRRHQRLLQTKQGARLPPYMACDRQSACSCVHLLTRSLAHSSLTL